MKKKKHICVKISLFIVQALDINSDGYISKQELLVASQVILPQITLIVIVKKSFKFVIQLLYYESSSSRHINHSRYKVISKDGPYILPSH